jgi:hypothetical protein
VDAPIRPDKAPITPLSLVRLFRTARSIRRFVDRHHEDVMSRPANPIGGPYAPYHAPDVSIVDLCSCRDALLGDRASNVVDRTSTVADLADTLDDRADILGHHTETRALIGAARPRQTGTGTTFRTARLALVVVVH